MRTHRHDTHRLEQRLRRIEEQLQDILLVLEGRPDFSPVSIDQMEAETSEPFSYDALISDIFRELRKEQNRQEWSLFSLSASNDTNWPD